MRPSIGERFIVPVVMPGLVALIGVSVLLGLSHPDTVRSWAEVVDERLFGTDRANVSALAAAVFAAAIGAVYLASLFIGVVLGIFGGMIEARWMDKSRPKRMGISKEAFDAEWHAYLNSLEKAQNAYISGFVETFLFVLRSSLALFVISGAALVTHVGSWWLPTILFSLTGLGLIAADADHGDLAEFRHRRKSSYPNPNGDVEVAG